MHNWSDGEVKSVYPLGDYKEKFGTVRTRADDVTVSHTNMCAQGLQ